jgi:gliding motility-associated-like protein
MTNCIRQSLFLLLFLISHTLPAQSQVDKLIAYYPFNGNAIDVSGNNYHANVNGAVLTTDRFNTPNSAYYFDGVNDNIIIPNSFDLQPKTISFWFNAYTIDNYSRVIYVSDNPYLNYGITAIEVKKINGINKLVTHITSSRDTATIQENTWHFFTITINKDSTHFYMDGVKIKSREITGFPKSNSGVAQTFIGSHRQGNTQSIYFHGKIDDVKIYNRELAQEEIAKEVFPPLTITAVDGFCIKEYEKMTLTALGYASYKWSDGSNAPTLLISQPGKYSLTAKDQSGKSYFGEITITACPVPDFSYTFDCATNIFTFKPILNFPFDNFHFKLDGTIVLNEQSTNHKFSKDGEYQVALNVYKDGREFTTKKMLSYTASVTPYLGEDSQLCFGEDMVLSPVVLPNTKLKWSDGSVNPSLTISAPGTYWVEATRGNCTIRDEITVLEKECQNLVKIPNIFTPNGDGVNDLFIIEGISSLISSVEQSGWDLEVYNRWGSKVYNYTNYKNNWTGGDLANGTYFYNLNNKRLSREYKGWVEILR